PDFRLAIDGFGDIYNITVVETADVADHFIGGAAAVTEMRRRFQGFSEWAVIVDLAEFVEFAGDLPAIIHQAEREGANVVRAVMWDRFGREGKVVGFDPGGDLRQVFPIRARFIKNVMLGADYKGVLVKGLIDSNVAHHTFIGEVVARASLALGHNPVIVEIGVFLGSCTVLLAGPRRRCGSGIVHCVDPFDGSGDAFSVPHYRRILDSLGGGSLRYHFDANIAS